MATQKVFCSYQEIIDLHTESDKVSVLGIHLPTGNTPHKMFKGLYDQFRKFRYLGADITLVPTARLPVDPLQVSYEAGEPTIDPRDVLNPIMFHGCHGEDLGNILNSLYTFGDISAGAGNTSIVDGMQSSGVDLVEMHNLASPVDNIDLMEKLYYKALTDNSWRKAHPQRGFKKSGLRPLVYKMATTHQIMPNESMVRDSFGDLDDLGIASFPEVSVQLQPYLAKVKMQKSLLSTGVLTNRLTSLGWMDTRTLLDNATYIDQTINPSGTKLDYNPAIDALYNEHGHLTELPRIFMGVILMPPAYKTEQYFRLIINHRFEFARFRSISFQNDIAEDTPAYHDWNEEISNGLGSGSLGDSASRSIELSGSSIMDVVDSDGDTVSLYPKLVVYGTEYTVTVSNGTGGFLVKDGSIYVGVMISAKAGGHDDNQLYYYKDGTWYLTYDSTSTAYTYTWTLSPTESDLSTELSGGIEYGE